MTTKAFLTAGHFMTARHKSCPEYAHGKYAVQSAKSANLQVEDGGARALQLLEHEAALLVEHTVDAAQRLLRALRHKREKRCRLTIWCSEGQSA